MKIRMFGQQAARFKVRLSLGEIERKRDRGERQRDIETKRQS
jgi:hypothetical protein